MSQLSELDIHQLICWGLIGTAVIVALLLLFVSAPYGRHARSGWGPTMPTKWVWILMESPAVLLFIPVYLMGSRRFELIPLLLLGLWQLHYVNRTFIFPLRMRLEGKRDPVIIAAMAFCYQALNAYVNARHISEFGSYDASWLYDPRFLFGVLLFLAGRQLNINSDRILRELRSDAPAGGERRYSIPQGGGYRWVSCPNYLGEIIEWTGFALASWSLAGAAFAIFTFANLAPRALANHRWYRDKFDDYPQSRRALIPYLL
jgi:3-oxo-5-alpha-steroid 4-dehydrogenase 1